MEQALYIILGVIFLALGFFILSKYEKISKSKTWFLWVLIYILVIGKGIEWLLMGIQYKYITQPLL